MKDNILYVLGRLRDFFLNVGAANSLGFALMVLGICGFVVAGLCSIPILSYIFVLVVMVGIASFCWGIGYLIYQQVMTDRARETARKKAETRNIP